MSFQGVTIQVQELNLSGDGEMVQIQGSKLTLVPYVRTGKIPYRTKRKLFVNCSRVGLDLSFKGKSKELSGKLNS